MLLLLFRDIIRLLCNRRRKQELWELGIKLMRLPWLTRKSDKLQVGQLEGILWWITRLKFKMTTSTMLMRRRDLLLFNSKRVFFIQLIPREIMLWLELSNQFLHSNSLRLRCTIHGDNRPPWCVNPWISRIILMIECKHLLPLLLILKVVLHSLSHSNLR